MAPQNKLSDLNEYLFAQLDALSNEDLSETDLLKEVERSKAINATAKVIISNGQLALDVMRTISTHDIEASEAPAMLLPHKGGD